MQILTIWELSLRISFLRGAGLTFTAVLAGSALVACAEVPTAEVGDCINSSDLADDEIDEITTVSCDEPHDLEVFHAFDLPEGDFPGEEAMSEAAEEECVGAFEDYVGLDYLDSELYITIINPTEDTWDTADDREILCVLQGEDATSSFKDSET